MKRHWKFLAVALAVAALILVFILLGRPTLKAVVLWNFGDSVLVADLENSDHRYLVDLSDCKLTGAAEIRDIPPGYEVRIRHSAKDLQFRAEPRTDPQTGESVLVTWTEPIAATKLELKSQAGLETFGDAVYSYLLFCRLSGETHATEMLQAMDQMLWEIENREMFGR